MDILLLIPVLLFSIILHEVAHGYVADRCGDPTARFMGRLTLNPVPHIDLIGSIIFPALLWLTHAPVLFGWAKPVPINTRNLKGPRAELMVSLAGISANLVLAALCACAAALYLKILAPTSGTRDALLVMLGFGMRINLILAVFNLMPIPPLDGSWVLYHLLPSRAAMAYQRIFPYGFLILIVLLLTNTLQAVIIPVYSALMNLLQLLMAVILQL